MKGKRREGGGGKHTGGAGAGLDFWQPFRFPPLPNVYATIRLRGESSSKIKNIYYKILRQKKFTTIEVKQELRKKNNYQK